MTWLSRQYKLFCVIFMSFNVNGCDFGIYFKQMTGLVAQYHFTEHYKDNKRCLNASWESINISLDIYFRLLEFS